MVFLSEKRKELFHCLTEILFIFFGILYNTQQDYLYVHNNDIFEACNFYHVL